MQHDRNLQKCCYCKLLSSYKVNVNFKKKFKFYMILTKLLLHYNREHNCIICDSNCDFVPKFFFAKL